MAEDFKFDNRKQRRATLAQNRRTMRKFKKDRGRSIAPAPTPPDNFTRDESQKAVEANG